MGHSADKGAKMNLQMNFQLNNKKWLNVWHYSALKANQVQILNYLKRFPMDIILKQCIF